MNIKLGAFFVLGVIVLNYTAQAQSKDDQKNSSTDPLAENMLVYQRAVGGWPKAIGKVVVKYEQVLSDAEKQKIKADSLHKDATIDNKATSREIRYLIDAYKNTSNPRYLAAVQKGIDYLLEAQYANGGWPQYYPDHSLYRGQITYNDNAMINVLNILQDIVEGKNNLDLLNTSYKAKAEDAVKKGIGCILKTQVVVDGKPTVWCAQHDEKTLKPAQARAFELVSLSGMESVNIVEFLMRIKHPDAAVKNAITAAVQWFEKSKIKGYDFVFVPAKDLPGGKDRILEKKTGAVIWARFYDIETNEPFFSGRDSEKRKTVAEIELERRVGYAWYGTWPAALLDKKYPAWLKKN
jgi:PelA/Pel-15E family pectate lyase